MAEEWCEDVDDELELDDDWYDDELLGPPKEEPDCFECSDRGCRWCDPAPWQRWWWIHIGHHLAAWRMRLRWRMRIRSRPTNTPFDEPPF